MRYEGMLAETVTVNGNNGDEIEAYGWDNPPAAFNLKRQREEYKLF